jgi:hypothetical protein
VISEQLVDVARRFATRYEGASVAFVSGSLVEGYGNAASDLDLLLLGEERPRPVSRSAGEEPAVFTFQECEIQIDFADGVRIDTELWRLADAERIADSLNAWDFSSRQAPPEYCSQFAHRVRIGLSLVAGEGFERLRARFDWDWMAVLLAGRFLESYNDLAEDATGAIQASDAGTAVLTSRWALGAAVDAHLAACGHTNAKAKWRFAKLRHLGQDDLLARYLATETDGARGDEEILAQAKQRLRLAAALAQSTQERVRPIVERRLPSADDPAR